jgi:hypothetical protein
LNFGAELCPQGGIVVSVVILIVVDFVISFEVVLILMSTVIKVEIVRLNARNMVLEPGWQVEYSLEQVDYISQDVKVLLRVQRICQETQLGNLLEIDLEAV